MARDYRRREPEKTVLYRVVQNNLATFVARAGQRGRTIPWFVKRELESYLDCGILSRGFVRVACQSCRNEHLVALSCKGRGFCSSCGGRHMTASAAHLVDNVFPTRAPVRQWVVSLPIRLRYLLAYDKELCARAVTLFVREISRWYRWCAKAELGLDSVQEARCGSVTVVQRFDSALRLNLHFHTLALDGVYLRDEDGKPTFYALPEPTTEDVARVAGWVRDKLQALTGVRGFDADDEPQLDLLAEEEPLLAECSAASITGTVASGRRAGRSVVRVREPALAGWRGDSPPERCANVDGFSIHANVSVRAGDRKRLEKVARYITRPPIASERLEELPDGRVQYVLRRPWSDGTTAVIYEPLELIDRLVALVPPPGFHRVRYHGVLAPAAPERPAVVPKKPSSSRTKRRKNYCWAELMKRAFDFDVLVCPRCSGRMRVLATIMEREAIRAILGACGFPADSPPPAPVEPPPGKSAWDAA